MIRKLLWCLYSAAAGVVWMLSTSAPVAAQIFDEDYLDKGSDTNYQVQLGMYSDRIFRGQNLYNGTSIQPRLKINLGVGDGSFFLGAFGHIGAEQGDPRASSSAPFDTTSPADSSVALKAVPVTEGFNEYDFDLGYSLPISFAKLDLGHRFFMYDEDNARLKDTNELFARLDFDAVAFPYLEVDYDYDEREGTYIEAGIRQPFSMGMGDERNAIVPYLTLGFTSGLDGEEDGIYDDSGLAFVDLGLKGQLYLNETFSLEPELMVNEGIDDATTQDITFGMNVIGSFN